MGYLNLLPDDISTNIWKTVYNSIFTELAYKRYAMGLCDEIEFLYSKRMCGQISYQQYCEQRRSFEADFVGDERDYAGQVMLEVMLDHGAWYYGSPYDSDTNYESYDSE